MLLYYRSAATGKIHESIEMFSCREGLLAPLKAVSRIGAYDDEEGDIGADTAAIDESAKSSATLLPTREEAVAAASANSSGAGTKSATVAAKSGAAVPLKNLNQRLITFDSTDPEFDEDSDPDADLDL